MSEDIHPWQKDAWAQLIQQLTRLPHAILFHGREGTGKLDFVETFARSLLCQSPAASGVACDTCASCNWFLQGNHPDYRRVRPEVLETEVMDSEEGEGEEKKSSKTAKTPSKEIKIDQIRALTGFMNISTHRNGRRIVLLYPAEALNTASANALLKTLEEPPPATLFLLLAHRIDRLLPTILSRCRQIALPVPSMEESLAWLAARNVDSPEIWLALEGGAPLAAFAHSQAESRDSLVALLDELAQPGIVGALRSADKFQKVPLNSLVSWLQRWTYDIFSLKLSGVVRYYPRHRGQLKALAEKVETPKLMCFLKSINERRAVADHPLSPKLFIEDMLLEYSLLFHEDH